ncbi:guanine nucleotide exchange factor for Rab-3A isoform X6 [Sphaerodactylus townsendi]|uniref:guanine nucleotide exchange factor for Rab-3A isoform X6 n=1 Tax=Sphaerodactylus townsendi TaxID=933632 RepID=UPI00202763C5|nr:guanine nucleotide exchange factor for Rab-3A isoform X6 [Sphaerodactylus townsendi]
MWGQARFEEVQKQPVVGQWKPLASVIREQELQHPEPPAKDCGSGDGNQSVAQLNVSRLRSSSVEIREKGSEFLKEELHRAQKELKLKDEECERLSKVREQLEQELEELTASLFEEAHKMVREANTKQAASEKQLREARGKIDMLQAEVTALKTLVITSTPSSPNRELHPQLQSPSKTAFRKGHGRNKSTSSAVVTPTNQSLPSEPVGSEFKESGVPTLLSLLLCIVPAKALHITYEPDWQSLATDSSFSSPSRQLSPGIRWIPSCLQNSRLGRNLHLWINHVRFLRGYIRKTWGLVWTSPNTSCQGWFRQLWSRIHSPLNQRLPRLSLW